MLANKKLSVLLLTLAFSSTAWAGLGGIAVRSSLGEPLRAEIDFTGADNELLRVGLAGSDTFRDLKVDYSAILSSLRFTLAQRSNGRSYIRVSSAAPISDPYLRFVVEARMPSGRSIREYTILLDPADYGSRSDAPVRAGKPVFEPELPHVPAAKAPPAVRRAVAEAPAVRAIPALVTVRAGQNLRQVAASLGIRDASLRQVMAALVEANPEAFPGGDPGHLAKGARLKVPAVSRIKSLTPARVSTLLDVRSAVAAAPAPAPTPAPVPVAPPVAAPAVPEQIVKLEPVEHAASAPAAEDSAEKAAQALALQQAQQKIADLEARLKALQGTSAPHVAVPVATHEPAQPEGSLLDSVMEYLPLIGGAVAAVLLGAASILMLRRRKKSAGAAGAVGAVLDKDAVGRMNLEAAAGGNTFLTDFTRTGMAGAEAGEVDPIAEAEVYLAYGRDQQAEEILKDALVKDPTRHEVRAKLLEIYAARQDTAAFGSHAASLHAALDGKGTLWDKVAKMGRGIDPANALYGAQAAAVVADTPVESSPAAIHIDLDSELMGDLEAAPVSSPAVAEPQEDDLLRAALLGEESTPAAPALAPELDIESLLMDEPVPAEPEPVAEPDDKHMLDFDFHLDEPVVATTPAEPVAAVKDANSVDFDFDLDLDEPAIESAVSTDGLTVTDDPLSTKLDLARVYLEMGDKDGAREVLEELMDEAEGSLKQDAAKLLASL